MQRSTDPATSSASDSGKGAESEVRASRSGVGGGNSCSGDDLGPGSGDTTAAAGVRGVIGNPVRDDFLIVFFFYFFF